MQLLRLFFSVFASNAGKERLFQLFKFKPSNNQVFVNFTPSRVLVLLASQIAIIITT